MWKIKSIEFEDRHISPIEIREREDKVQGLLDALASFRSEVVEENPEDFLRELRATLQDHNFDDDLILHMIKDWKLR